MGPPEFRVSGARARTLKPMLPEVPGAVFPPAPGSHFCPKVNGSASRRTVAEGARVVRGRRGVTTTHAARGAARGVDLCRACGGGGAPTWSGASAVGAPDPYVLRRAPLLSLPGNEDARSLATGDAPATGLPER
ncbi:hypothetical protein GCM10010518_49890 [Kitasatospora cinereorecta]